MTFESLIDPRLLDDVSAETGPTKGDWKALEWEVEQVRRAVERISAEPQAVARGLIRAQEDLVREAPRRSWLFGKRMLDVGLGTVLAIAALPAIAGLAVCVAMSMRTWPFFVQRRVGRDGRVFPFPKLRTLPKTTPRYASKYDIPTDIGRVASFLRRTHLDELPQLLVVPFGWMSLVGPRPEMPEGSIPTPRWFVEVRTRVPQGCTGLWQISPHTHLLLHEAPEYDLFYARHASLRLDLWILWRTVRQSTRSAPPVRIGDIPAWAMNRAMRPLEAEAAS